MIPRPTFDGTRVEALTSSDELSLFVARVVDRGVWKGEIAQLTGHFGALLFLEWEGEVLDATSADHRRRLAHQYDLSFAGADAVYALVDDQGVVGYASVGHLPADPAVAALFDIVVARRARGQARSERLYRALFENERGLSALVGMTKTPQVVRTRTRAGAACGWVTYFGASGREHADVRHAQDLMRDHYADETRSGAPDGYLFLRAEENTLPPLRREEVALAPGDPLWAAFERLLALQKAAAPNTAVGFITSVPRPPGRWRPSA